MVTATAVTESTGIEGQVRAGTAQAGEFAEDFSDYTIDRAKRYEQWAPFILPVAGVAALYVTIKALRPY